MEIPKNLLEYIAEEAQRVNFGSIRIEINENSKKMDVVTEYRKRFEHDGNYPKKGRTLLAKQPHEG